MFDGPIEDRLAIRERIDAYADAVFRHDAEAWIANWAEDAVWALPGSEVSGRANIRAAWEKAMSAFAVAGFFSVPGAIEVNGDHATARDYTQEILLGHDGSMRRIVGAYEDTLVKAGGKWLFQSRRYRVLHQGEGVA